MKTPVAGAKDIFGATPSKLYESGGATLNVAELHAEILAGLKRWSASQDWVEDDGRFIKAPLVWLNQENWNDNPAPYSPRSAMTLAERAAEERERKAKELSAAMRRSAVAALTAKDWTLCREVGCRHCAGNRCSRGVALPPDHRLNARPCRPEECPRFEKGLPSAALAEEGGAA